MGHAQHFLERLPRVGDDHIQRALSLYYSSTYTQSIIHIALSPDACDPDKTPEQPEQRVAIALDDSSSPPFIIANRAGRMITCLAPGMSPFDTPTIDHARLRFACDRHDTLKGRKAAYTQLSQERANIVLPLIRDGWAVSRSTFRGLSFLAPWLQIQFFASALDTEAWLFTHRQPLAKILRKGQIERPRSGWVDPKAPPNVHPHIINRHGKEIDQYWSQLWFATHTTLLACAESPHIIFETLAKQPSPSTGVPMVIKPENRLIFLNCLTDDGFLPQIIRALWVFGSFGEFILPSLEHYLHREHRMWEAIIFTAAIAVIGMRHPHLYTKTCNILARYQNFPYPNQRSACLPFIHALTANIFNILEHPERAATMRIGRAKQSQLLYDNYSELHPSIPRTTSDKDALSFCSFLPLSMHIGHNDEFRLMSFLFSIPWVACADVEDLYAPDDQIPIFKDPARGSCVDALLGYAASMRDTTAYATPPDARTPSRNDPCPCGSNKKYKVCCLRKPSA